MNLIFEHQKQAQIFNSTLCIIGITVSVMAIIDDISRASYGIMISDVMLLVALILALVYIYRGHKKETAGYYKGMLYLFLISTLISIVVNIAITPAESARSLIGTTAIALIGFATVSAVAFIPNLGKKKSMLFAAINLAMRFSIFVIVSLLMLFVPRARETQSIQVIYRTFVLTVLSIVIYINTCYKYIDKAERNAE
ncbi:MAG: hypothetical protein J6S38_04140 [Erysipelotrichaceae bacterium]|nr:hypothetical protein [Erysipelotrichaceae bacterium]